MKIIPITLLLIIFLFGIMALSLNVKDKFLKEDPPALTETLDATTQSLLTPQSTIKTLIEGNDRFVNNEVNQFDYRAQISSSLDGQFPKAAILACNDSRVPVEKIFNKSIGDLYVTRIAGNVVNDDVLGGLEFATKTKGAKVVIVLGHEQCDAVKSAINNNTIGNIASIVNKIEPAISSSKEFNGMKISKNTEYVNTVSKNNVLLMIEKIKSESPILKQLNDEGQIEIIGAIYKMETGKVVFL